MDTKYHITQENQQWDIQSVQEEKDLGVLTTSDLSVSKQCTEAASKANRVLGMVKRQFRELEKGEFSYHLQGICQTSSGTVSYTHLTLPTIYSV